MRDSLQHKHNSRKKLTVISRAFILTKLATEPALTAGIIEAAVLGYVRIHEHSLGKLTGASHDYILELIKLPLDTAAEQRALLGEVFDGDLIVGATVSIRSQNCMLHHGRARINAHLARQHTLEGYL